MLYASDCPIPCFAFTLLSLFYQELGEVDLMMNDAREDQDLKELAKEERTRISRIVDDMEKTLVQSLVPKDIADSGNAILEIRAGNLRLHSVCIFYCVGMIIYIICATVACVLQLKMEM